MAIYCTTIAQAERIADILHTSFSIIGIALPNELFILRPDLDATFIVRIEI